jgi:hypothetical protein
MDLNQPGEITPDDIPALVNTRLPLVAFHNMHGTMAGIDFVKVVAERKTGKFHFINDRMYSFHADYIAEHILKIEKQELRDRIDAFNQSVYLSEDREFYLGIVSLHRGQEGDFFALETVEIDNMNLDMLIAFYESVRNHLDGSIPIFFKPANHQQEAMVSEASHVTLPRVYSHELFSNRKYIPLNIGQARGRLRIIKDEDFERTLPTIEWYDIVAMDRVPDSIPRISGIINGQPTTPLSHTNVLACGWQIPNAIQVGILTTLRSQGYDGQWIEYNVSGNNERVDIQLATPPEVGQVERPSWSVNAIQLAAPEVKNTPITALHKLRKEDSSSYGTKAANLGELSYVLSGESGRLTGFYRIPRPPRKNLQSYLECFLESHKEPTLSEKASSYMRKYIKIPRGIALPFSFQQDFLESAPKIQQAIGKLKMALELDLKEIEPLCVLLQNLIRSHKMSRKMREQIDSEISYQLAGVAKFVVRSSSNAEDLKDFSAAGIYESINHVTTADRIFEGIKEVWASLVSPRSVRLRHQVGIALDECYMGVIIQEQVPSDMGGVLVTTNPMNPKDFRNVFINASDKSAVEVVEGSELPIQYLYNTVEGGGRTLSIGSHKSDFKAEQKKILQPLAICGRLLQSHFAQDYTFSGPVDIEWAADGQQLYILQLRPFSG